MILGYLEAAAAARIDVAGRAVEKNADRIISPMLAGEALDFVDRETHPVTRVEQVVVAEDHAVTGIVEDERDRSAAIIIDTEKLRLVVGDARVISGEHRIAIR